MFSPEWATDAWQSASVAPFGAKRGWSILCRGYASLHPCLFAFVPFGDLWDTLKEIAQAAIAGKAARVPGTEQRRSNYGATHRRRRENLQDLLDFASAASKRMMRFIEPTIICSICLDLFDFCPQGTLFSRFARNPPNLFKSFKSFWGVACGEKLFKIGFKIIQNLFVQFCFKFCSISTRRVLLLLGRFAQNYRKIGLKNFSKFIFL